MKQRSSIFGHLEGDDIRHDKKGRASKSESWIEAILPADADASPVEGELDRRPLWYFGGALVLVLLVLAFRLFVLQVAGGNYNLALADGNLTRTQLIRAPRGVIYDRNNTLLASNLPSYDITAVPQQLPQTKAARQVEYANLSKLIGVSASTIQSKAEAPCDNNHTLACLDYPEPELITSNIPRTTALLFEQDSESYPGFSLDVNPIRQYNEGPLLAQVLGYTGRVTSADLASNSDYSPNDYIGETGIEYQYDSLLRGTDGEQETEVDASGQPVKLLASKNPVAGDSLVLSIDSGLQADLAKNLQAAMNADTAAHPTEAAAVALNPNTGEVLALVSLPTYDDNLFAKGISSSVFSGLINNPAQPLFDKVISGVYPTGSIIKPLVASAALTDHTITTSTTIDDIGYLSVPNENDPSAPPQLFHSYEPGGFGIVNLMRAMAVSSNVFFMAVGGGYNGAIGHVVGLGVERLTKFYNLFGLGSKSGIDLPDESAGLVPTPAWKQKVIGQPWYLGDTYNISVGQGNMLVSPLQMAVAISAIANGGKVIVPHVLDKVIGPDGQVIETVKTKVVRQNFIDPQALSLVQQAMRGVVTSPEGTGCCFIEKQVPVDVAAKTGTAENGSPEAHAWFEAYAPYEDPQIVIVALIANGGEGGYVTAPAVRATLSWYFTQGAGKNMGPHNPTFVSPTPND